MLVGLRIRAAAMRVRAIAARAVRTVRGRWNYRNVPESERIAFRCNVCGHRNSLPRSEMGREAGGCLYCGSTVRWRSIIHALSMEIFGQSLALVDFPVRKDIRGVGLSDWTGYADGLAKKFSYKNTYYHCEPMLNISKLDPLEYEKYDFLISSDVFEHVAPPVRSAFEGARKLLKAGGVMIFTVPYVPGFTKEHFPELNSFSIEKRGDNWILSNQTADGRKQEFKDITFHGGPGSTVEMRLFGKESLTANFQEAGFKAIRECSEEVPELGILWLEYDPEKAPYRPLIYGLDTPPWVARRAVDKLDV